MSQQPTGQADPGGDDWPDYLWPAEDGSPDVSAPGTGMAATGPPRRFRPGIAAVVVLVAALAGAGIAVTVQTLSGPSAGAPAGHQPVLSPAQPGGNTQPGGPFQPGGTAGNGLGGGGAGGAPEMFMTGQVTAVSGDSISIAGPGRTITAGVTSATRIAGTVTSISGIKIGDQVSAQLALHGAKLTALAIQYPAQIPAQGGPGG